MEATSIEKEQLQRSFKLDSIGPHSSKMLITMHDHATTVNELASYLDDMKCHYKTFRR